MTVLSFPIVQSPYAGLGDELVGGLYAGQKLKENALSFPETLAQLQANTKIKNTEAQYAPQNAQLDIQRQQLANALSQNTLDYAPTNSQLDIQRKRLANAISQNDLKYAPQMSQAALQAALLGNQEKQIDLKYLPDKDQAAIDSLRAMANYRNMGGGTGGVAAKQQMFLVSQIKKDNPNLTDDQVWEAAGNLVNGSQTLNDGTPFNASGLTQLSADKAVMQGTTSALTTQNVKSNQADAELGVLNDYAQKGLAPYGDTFLGMNPDQISDSFKSDPESQTKLGRFIASQALQYEIAQNRIRLANGQPGINSTEELMNLSAQQIKAKYPKLSYAARKEAARYMDEALRKGLQARNSVSHPSKIRSNSNYSQGSGLPSSDDIEFTAKKYGMTVDQVKNKLGIQ